MLNINLVVTKSGTVKHIYNEGIDFLGDGAVKIKRVSHVEPNEKGRWTADMSPVGGPVIGPFDKRSDALSAEIEWLWANTDRW